MKKNDKKRVQQPTFDRPVDRYFYELDQQFGQGSKAGFALSLALAFFGVMGMVWMVPFPKLAFLENLNMQNFLNWGSFYIAIIIYLYLRLAPTLSYAMLFSIAVMSFFIVQLEYLERAGGPSVWLASLLIALTGVGITYVQARKEKPGLSLSAFWTLLSVGPIWLWSKLFASLKIKY